MTKYYLSVEKTLELHTPEQEREFREAYPDQPLLDAGAEEFQRIWETVKSTLDSGKYVNISFPKLWSYDTEYYLTDVAAVVQATAKDPAGNSMFFTGLGTVTILP